MEIPCFAASPLRGPGASRLRIGDRVWFRHAKAGELCEHVDVLHTLAGEALTGVVVDGKLYLNFNDQAKKLWSEDVPGNIKKGEENWPKLNTH